MKLGAEASAVQRPILRYAQEVGWQYVPPEEAVRLRRGEASPVFHQILEAQLLRLNPGVVDQAKAEELVRRLVRVPPTIEGNLQAWEYLKGLKTVFVEAERRERNVRFLDPDPARNTFHVTDEFTFTNGTYTIRADVVFLVNGVPVLLVETKAATRKEGIAEALDQLRRYHRECPELMAITQAHTLTHLIHFYYGATWMLSRKGLFNWRDEQTGDFETLVKSFLAPRRVVEVLQDCILFTRKDNELSKVVLRPHQMRAVGRVLQRARDPKKRRGLVWHTQGSGKTYTMITVAKQLIEQPAFGNPTVLMLVDRNELESQLFRNLQEVGFGTVHVAESKRDLEKLLEQGTRGLVVTMIHKFEGMPANVLTRENVFVLVDEAHRTTGGDLGNYLMGAIPNATYIGFTGTPIDRTAHGKGTFEVFGTDDPKGYLDKYSIKESIQDGTTVPLYYRLAPNELRVDRETLEREFLSLAELEGVSDVEELNRVLERAVTLRNMLKNAGRMAKVARHVADHFKSTVQPMGYKAFLVAVDREACVRYKCELDKHLPPEASRVVISRGHNDSAELAACHLSEEEEKEIRKAFIKPDQDPQILIVTEKLLTGFDAPILYCMYLDKPLRDHVLLQAIARVNRPYEDDKNRRKHSGFVLDFVGIFDHLERALAFDSADVSGVVQGLDVLEERFASLMEAGRREYLPIPGGRTADKAVEAILEHFRDKARRDAFYQFFRELEELYEILSPAPFLRPFLENYDALVSMYHIVRANFEPHVDVDRSFLRKTAELVQEHTASGEVQDTGEVYRLTPEAIEKLARDDTPDTVRVFNLLKTFQKLVEQEGARTPYLISIGERAEQVAAAFHDRQLSTQDALQRLDELIGEYQQAEDERRELNLSAEGFAVYWLLHCEQGEAAEDCAREAGAAFAEAPHWKTSARHEREVRRALYRILAKAKVQDPVAFVEHLMSILRRGA